MEKTSLDNKKMKNIQKLMFFTIGILAAIVLFLSAASHNTIQSSRTAGNYVTADGVVKEERAENTAPVGKVYEYRFTLGKIQHADTLAFYITHHNIKVYLGEECVQSVTASQSPVSTVGGIWVWVPLYESDGGKEVRVVLEPLYKDYQKETPVFFIGSELAIYKAAFYRALPELILCLCTMLAGVVLFCLALYYSIRSKIATRLYAISLLAVSAGMWRFTYGSFVYLLFTKHTVFVYTVSVISLMVVAMSMLYSVQIPEKIRGEKAVHYLAFGYGICYVIQLLFQILGFWDLRQFLAGTHITIIISAAVIFKSVILEWYRKTKVTQKPRKKNYAWLLGAGVIVDLLLYYFAETTAGMLFTLGTILCFSILEGMNLLNSYTEQKNALEEMETKLILSRTMTMMSQIRSHFVFNLLNAISGMCKYDPEKADATVVRFARYLRNNIDIMEEDKNISFSADLKQLEDYVALEQVRFGDKIEFYMDVETEDFMIPPLILQPVVENAIKHGVSKKQGNGMIILKTYEKDDKIVITIEDDGVGFDKKELEKEKSVGLKNIRFRLEHLVNGTFEIESEKGKGTLVTITIPK